MGWYDWISGIGLVIVLVLVIVALVLVSGFDDNIDTEDAILTVTASSGSAVLTPPPSANVQLVSAGNAVIMTLTGFAVALSGVSASLQTSAIPSDFWPSVAVSVPIIVSSNSVPAVGLMTISTTGVISVYAGPANQAFATGALAIQNIGTSWTQNVL